MEVTKEGTVSDDGDGILGVGDTVNYTIRIENQGNVNITEPLLVDTFTDALSNTLALSSGPTFNFADLGSSQGIIKPNETAHYGATFVITQAVVDAGGLINSVTVTASSTGNPGGLSDVSDDGDDTDGNTTDDATVLVINPAPIIETTKTATVTDNNSNGLNDLGDTIVYTITVENKGNVTLSGLSLADTLTDGDGGSLSLTSGPTFNSSTASSAQGTLTVGETASYTATYTITQDAVDSGSVVNTVMATASSPQNTNDVTDRSDNGDDSDGETQDDNTVVVLSRSSQLEATKTALVIDNNTSGSTDLGDTIVYTITVENKGNVTLRDVGLTDTLLDGNGSPLSLTAGPTFISSTASSAQGTLTVGETATYTASYTITQAALDTGGVSNSVLVTGSSPGQSDNVTDTSDDGDDSDGNTEDDTTDTSIDNSPSLEVTKTSAITDNGDGVVGKGDVVQYTISVINNGNVTLSGLTVVDVLSDATGTTLSLNSGPSFSGSSQGSAQGTLKVGETASYSALYIITQAAVDAGGISNQASATASSPGNSNDVSDMSDDGDDSDGNTTDDPTVTSITASSLLEVTKTAAITDNGGDGNTGAGDIINYTITVENKGNVTLTGLTLVDTLTDGSGGSLTLTNGPSFSSTTLGSSPGTLKPDEIATYSGYYIISSAAALTSSVNNSVLATASSPGQTNNVTDTSDDGDDSDGNTEDDVTVVEITPLPEIEATKTATTIDNNSNGIVDLGDTIVYTITVENKGNTSLSSLTLVDTLSDGSGGSLTLTSGPTFTSSSAGSSQGTLTLGETATYTASYTIAQTAVDAGGTSNTVNVTASSPGNIGDVTDTSDDGDDTDGNTTDDPTIVTITASPEIEVTKTATVTDNNGDGNTGAGDTIVYTITVQNTGGTTLSNITLNDVLTDGNGTNLSLTAGPLFVSNSASSAQGTLAVNEIGTYIATYTISNAVENTSSVNNRVTVTASSPGQSNNVTDVSDDGDDSDGNTQDDPTVVSIDAVPLLEVTKTASVTDDGDGYTGPGDVINYVITIENKGNVTLSSLTVTDSLTDGNGGSLVMSNGPYFSGSDQGSAQGILIAGETATYQAYYIISSSAADAGDISNIATATASSPGNSNDVFDQSDDGDDSDGNTVDDPTVTSMNPVPSIEVIKSVNVIDNNSNATNDISDTVVYTITVNNTGNLLLTNVSLNDVLTDGNGNVLSLDAGPTFVSATTNSNAQILQIGGNSTFTATYTIAQNVAYTGLISNQVSVTANTTGGINVSDLSDDGDDSDGNTVDDPTVIITSPRAMIEVTKTASVVDINGNGNNDQGDVIVYTITVANTGSVTLSGLSLTDTLTDGSGGSLSLTSGPTFNSNSASSAEGSLAVGEISTYTATYTISQNAANTGSVNNSVSVTASTPGNSNDVTDVSDDGDDTDGNTTNDATVVLTSSDSSIEVTKTAVVNDTNSNGKTDQGDVIVYNITVRNTGNITLSSITISDTLTDGNGGPLSLDSGPTFVSNSGSSAQGTLISGEIATYTATYTISAAAENTPSVNNTAQAIASTPGNSNDVTDVSDNGNDGDGNTTNDPTVVNITASPQMEVTKEGTVSDDGDGILGVGDTVNYTIRIENQGNVNITEPLLVDTFTDALSNTLALSSGPTFNFADLGSSQGIIKPNETAHYGATFVITQAVVDAGGLINSVTVTASSTGNPGGLSDVSDDGDDTDGNTTDDTTVLVINPAPIIETTKTATVIDNNSNGLNDLGDTIVYTITVENKGNVTLSGLSLADTLTDGDGGSLSLTSGPTFNSSTASSAQGTLTVGETASYTATYTITQDAVDSGSVVNTVMATASSPQNTNDVTDRSDNGDDSDGETQDDNTVVVLSRSSQLEATKTALVIDNNTSGSTDLGDTIVYTITVENKGNVTLRDVVLTDTLLDGNGSPLSLTAGPTFISSTASSAQGTLTVGETATYTASYTITQAALDTGGVSNSVLVTGSSPGQSNNVTDTSDDGDDSDGNTEDDTTDTSIDNSPSLEVTKTSAITDNGDGVVGKGDVVQYTISVINNGNVTLSGLTVVDVLSDATGTTLSLNSGPSFSGSSQGSAQGTLKVGETASYSALYIITQAAVDAGGISNQASATASSPGNSNDVSDMSDDGDDSDGNTTDDPTVTSITASSLLEVTKTAVITDNGGDGNTGAGDIINYTITVENKGNVTLTGLTLVDTLTDGSGGSLTLTNGPSFSSTTLGSSPGTLKPDEIATYSGYYIISSAAALTSSVNNSVLATASSPGQTNNVTDTSDDGDDSDGNTEDDVTVVEITPLPEIEATKTATTIDNNSNGIVDLGDTIVYTITVENKGNTSLSSLTLVDTLSDGSGGSLSLTSGPTFTSSSAGSSQGTLTLGETATYTASYTIAQTAVDAGGTSNTVNVTASSPGNTGDVTDTSDDGDDTDGNTTDDPTIVTITASPEIEVTKTATVTDNNGDGNTGAGDTIVYTITVQNTGGTTLSNITLNDVLTDGNGTNLSLTAGPLFVSNSASSAQGTLAVNEIGTYIATYTISNAVENTSSVNNRVTVTASSPGQSNNVTDVSDDGDDSDGNTQDDPTVVSIDAVPLLEVTKTASVTDDGDGYTGPGDVINYVITIENKGNVTLSSLTVTDSLTDGNGGSLVMSNGPYFSGSDQGSAQGILIAGETATYQAYYIVPSSYSSTQISNIATATASSPGNSNDVFDQSDDGDDSDGNTEDDPTIVDIVPNTSMEITKTAIVIDNGDGVNGASDKVVYTITVNNTGDTSLTGVTISDTLTDANGTALSLDAGPTFTSSTLGSSQGSLASGEIATYTATYTIIQNVANTGSISNIVTGTASSPGQSNNVTDTSDDGDDSDGNTVDDPTIVNTQSSGGVEVTKTASVVDINGNGNNDQGDVIVYTITVANTGSVTLSGLSLTDTLTDGSGGSLSLTSGPTFNSNSASSAEGSLAVGEISTYTATYTISQNAANTGSVNNSVSVTASTPGNSNDVTDVSDDGDDTDGNTTNDATVVLTSSDSSIEVTKTAVVNDTNSNGKTDQGDVIVYNITVRNTGNITLSSITISDTLTDGNGGPLSLDSGPTFVSNSGSSAQGTLISGEIATYTATYTISAAAENTPSVNNTAQAIASTPGNSNDVTDVSDNGNDGDGNTTNDPTVVNITASPQMEVTKEGTVSDDGDGILGVGDTVNYTIRIENQGNVNITEPLLVDTFTDALSNTLALSSGPTFNFADLGSSQGIIKPNETAHYGATFVITQAVVDAGGLINSVTVTASSTGNPGGLSDVSDDGDDTDGNTTDDTTVLVINPAPIIETTKTATVTDNNSNGLNDLGDTIVYTITVENKGNVTLSGLSLADTLTDGDGGSLSLTSGPTFNSSTASSAQGTLTVGETASYTATYTITQDAVDSGSVVNTVMATASSPQNTNDVTDRSDNGDDSDGETQDDNTVVVLSRSSQLEATKTALVIDNNTSGSTDLGDTIVYTITVENKGNVTLRDVGLTDTLLDGNGSSLSLTAGPTFISSTASSAQGTLTVGETATYTASYTITQAALDTGGVSNSVLVTGSSPGQSDNVTDTSDDGDDSDGNTEDDTTDTSIDNSPSLEVTKTSAITDNGDGVVGKGDVVQYTISVINNGNVTLSGLTVVGCIE